MKLSMSNLLILVGIVVVAVVAFSCKSKEKAMVQQAVKKELTAEEIRQLPKILEYSKSPCYGFCPHFNMTVYEGGWAIFEGKRHTAKQGIAIVQLDKMQVEEMMQQCQQADLWSAEASYGMRIQDLPTTTVHLFEGGKEKTVQWRMRHPERLKRLDGQLMELVTKQGWVTPVDVAKDRAERNRQEVKIDNELIIQLRDKLEGTVWVEKYKEYGMHLKKPISKLANMYLFIYDTKLISADKMLKIIQADEKVARAEFNKRLESRTR